MTKWQLLGTACRNNNNKQKQKKNWAACIDDLCMWCVCSETRKYENNLRLSFSFCRSFRSHPDSHLNKCWLFYDNHSHCHFYIFVRLFCRAVFRAFSLSRSMYTRGCLCVIFLYHLLRPLTSPVWFQLLVVFCTSNIEPLVDVAKITAHHQTRKVQTFTLFWRSIFSRLLLSIRIQWLVLPSSVFVPVSIWIYIRNEYTYLLKMMQGEPVASFCGLQRRICLLL